MKSLNGRPHLVLSGCCLALVLVMASVTSVNLALEGIAVDLNAAGSDLTWIADAYTVALRPRWSCPSAPLETTSAAAAPCLPARSCSESRQRWPPPAIRSVS